MNLAPPIPRFGRGPDTDVPTETVKGVDVRRTANRSPAKAPTQVLQRERHQPDYLILVIVVALSAVGILMVYSSSAMRGYSPRTTRSRPWGRRSSGRCSGSSRWSR